MTNVVMRIIRSGETYTVDENGMIGRPAIGMKPSGGWQFTGIERYSNFGHRVAHMSFRNLRDPNILAGIKWKYKNGKSRWHGCDIDHGTSRVWASPNDLQWIELVS